MPTDAERAAMPSKYIPADHEPAIRARWDASRAFHADPERVLGGEALPYAIVIPPPNVTAALHLGHALNNTLQDVLIRARRDGPAIHDVQHDRRAVGEKNRAAGKHVHAPPLIRKNLVTK